jgi:lipoate synthase
MRKGTLKKSGGKHLVMCGDEILCELGEDDLRNYAGENIIDTVSKIQATDHRRLIQMLTEKFPDSADDELVAALTEKMESGCDYSEALRQVTKTEAGQRLWHRHVLEAESGLRKFQPEKVTLADRSDPSELELAVNRYMTDNGLDYPTALKQFTATPKGRQLWANYARGGE